MKFFGKLAKARKSSRAGDAPSAVPPHLERVRSVQDCLDVFEAESMFSGGTISDEVVSALYSHCTAMREQGMALEPNLIGRAVTHAVVEPARAGEIALRFASHDTDFVGFVTEADELLRFKRDIAHAEYLYWRALVLYPKHPLMLVQYAHSLKEQGKHPDSLTYYLDAAVFGAPMSDVEEHALFVAGLLGLSSRVAVRLSAPLSIPCSSHVRALYELLIGHGPTITDTLHLMIEHKSIPSIVTALMGREEFCQANRDLLRLIVETQWSPASA